MVLPPSVGAANKNGKSKPLPYNAAADGGENSQRDVVGNVPYETAANRMQIL